MKKCTVCSHPARAEIELALVGGASCRHVASRFSLGYKAVNRHALKCMGRAIALADETRERGSGFTILDALEDINREAKTVLQEAKKAKDPHLVLLAVDRLCKEIELRARCAVALQAQAALTGGVDGSQKKELSYEESAKHLMRAIGTLEDMERAMGVPLNTSDWMKNHLLGDIREVKRGQRRVLVPLPSDSDGWGKNKPVLDEVPDEVTETMAAIDVLGLAFMAGLEKFAPDVARFLELLGDDRQSEYVGY